MQTPEDRHSQAKQHTAAGVEFNSNTLIFVQEAFIPVSLEPKSMGIPQRTIRLHREPLLPQRVTPSKPCNDDSTIPTRALQEVKVIIFAH